MGLRRSYLPGKTCAHALIKEGAHSHCARRAINVNKQRRRCAARSVLCGREERRYQSDSATQFYETCRRIEAVGNAGLEANYDARCCDYDSVYGVKHAKAISADAQNGRSYKGRNQRSVRIKTSILM